LAKRIKIILKVYSEGFENIPAEVIHNMIQEERWHQKRKKKVNVKSCYSHFLSQIEKTPVDNKNGLVEVTGEFNLTKFVEALLECSFIFPKRLSKNNL
jgi:hypothetical protein